MSKIYKNAGVDIEAGDDVVTWLQEQKSVTPAHKFGEPIEKIGGFASLFSLNVEGLKKPALVSSTDGVGTKVLLALETGGEISGLGIDLVAMCVNDLFTLGATPLFFLDYYATGALDRDQFKQVLTGIQLGLKTCGCSLAGGETAEMPGLYAPGHLDLAGFVVGIVDQMDVLGKEKVKNGDELWALPSSGFHSNGYSLIRKWLKDFSHLNSPELRANLLKPTKIYAEMNALKPYLSAAAHITGGGISGNLPRVMPTGAECRIYWEKLPTPRWMESFIKDCQSSKQEVEEVFNLGAGMIVVVSQDQRKDFLLKCAEVNLSPANIGSVSLTPNSHNEAKVIYL